MYTHAEVEEATLAYFNGDDLATNVWITKYALRDNEGNLLEKTPDDMHRRIASEFARIEKSKFKEPLTEDEIYEYLKGFKRIIPQGSVMYGCGNKYQYVTLSNCYTLPSPYDSYLGINYLDTQISQISSRRGGVGWDMSTLRPKDLRVKNAAGSTTGAISFMHRYSNTIREVCQCLIRGSQVLTKNGIKNIEDVEPAQDYVWTKKGWVLVTNRFYKPQVNNLYEIITKTGYSICASLEHQFAMEQEGVTVEKCLKDINIGDKIILIPGAKFINNNNKLTEHIYPKKDFSNKSNRLQDIKLPLEISEDLAYFIGYSYGDGHVQTDKFDEPYALSLACSNDYLEIQNKLIDIAKKEFQYNINVKDGDGDLKVLYICSKRLLYHLLQNVLLKQKSNNQPFPEIILKSSSDIQSAFLSGYFDADGYASGSKKGYAFASVNKNFIQQTQLILMANGIPSKIHCENREKQGWQDLYTLCIVGKYAQESLLKLFKHSVKIQNKNFISKIDCWLTPYTAKNNNIKYGNYNYINNKDHISAQAYCKLKNEEKLDLFELLLQDEIIAINQIQQQDCFDLELESEHLFWCNGFYVHNSGRRGASLQSLNIQHPEIRDFIKCKNDDVSITGSNISIQFKDSFMDCVINNKEEFELKWPVDSDNPKVSKKVNPQVIWKEFIENTWSRAEPGAIFIDTVHRRSTSAPYPNFKEVTCNPCAEQMMPEYSCCRLICINLYTYVKNKFTKDALFDYKQFSNDVKLMQRLADDMVDLDIECIDRIINKIKSDPEPIEIKRIGLDLWENIKSRSKLDRRTGCGIVGLADTLAALNLKYDSNEAIEQCDFIFNTFKLSAFDSSVEMAKELGAFPVYDYNLDKNSEFIQDIKQDDINLYNRMKKYGRRNMTLLTVAPTGSVSLLTQTSSGIEPVFMLSYTRRKKINPSEKDAKVDFVDKIGDKWSEYTVFHKGLEDWKDSQGLDLSIDVVNSPYKGSTAHEIDYVQKVRLQAAIQKHIDNSISVTTNLPKDISKEKVAELYLMAYKLGCKGFTIYRDGCRSGVLVSNEEKDTKFPNERPRELPCDVHHITIKGQQYFILVGLLDDKPYEVFAGKNGFISKKVQSGTIIKKRKDFYKATFNESDEELSPITASTSEMEECVTRLVSGLLRTGADMHFVVKQLEKVGERQTEMHSFARSVARALKKYIPDGTKDGSLCPECGSDQVIRVEGCNLCQTCGHSKCL